MESNVKLILEVNGGILHKFTATSNSTDTDTPIQIVFWELEKALYPLRHEMIVRALNGE